MKSINHIYNEIQEAKKFLHNKSEEINPDKWHPTNHITYNPQGKNFVVCDENKHAYRTTVQDHNGAYIVFMFHTTDVYGRHQGAGTGNIQTELDILKTSETRKVFYKDEIAEIGLTIEHKLRRPTDTCWGYSWGYPSYYILKDGNLTISESFSVIRKIYKGLKTERDYDLIRFENEMKTITAEIIDISEIHDRKVFLAETESGDYLIGNKDDIWEWVYELYDSEEYLEWWIQELGGKDEIVKKFVSGVNFNPANYLYYNFELKDVIPYDVAEVDDCDDRLDVKYCTWDVDNAVKLSGRSALKIIQ